MCGIYLLYSKDSQSISNAYNGLKKIQHRGHDSYGILCKSNDKNIFMTHMKGLIDLENETCKEYIKTKKGNLFMGHLRYKTSGLQNEAIKQPIVSSNHIGSFSFIFNGNIPCNEYDNEFSFDTKMIQTFFEDIQTQNVQNFDDLLIKFVNNYARAYSLILATDTAIYLVKDRYGVRPLCYSLETGILEVASESPGISINSTHTEVKPGEILKFKLNDLDTKEKQSFKPEQIFNYNKSNLITGLNGGKCIFEYIYFLSPKTVWNNLAIEEIRNEWAKILAKNDRQDRLIIEPESEYLVIGIPSTGIIPGKKYAETTGLIYQQAITKNVGVNRTFILDGEERDRASKKKYIYDKTIIEGKIIIIIDDSIVRGVTMRNIVSSLFNCGALEVHLRIISPQIKDICKYGIDIPKKVDLVAANMSLEEMTLHFGATTLRFLEVEEMLDGIDPFVSRKSFCTGCFDSNYGADPNENVQDIEDIWNSKMSFSFSDIKQYLRW